jgi:Mn-containing catalase
MFFHTKHLQYHAAPARPDPAYAKKLQEVLGGQWGEITVMMQYLFQGWNCRGPAKYRDMLLAIGTEEMAHVEMLATMIARLLENATADQQESAVQSSPAVGAVLGGSRVEEAAMAAAMNPQHIIVSGLGATPNDAVGFPWTARYMTASGNLLADFRFNLTAESMGRLQVARLYHLTYDPGVRDMLSFLLARDAMHQNQWLAAIADLEAEGLDGTPCPLSFDARLQKGEVAYLFNHCSDGRAAAEGMWASGTSPDGKGRFEFIEEPRPMSDDTARLGAVDPRMHGTPRDRRMAQPQGNGHGSRQHDRRETLSGGRR